MVSKSKHDIQMGNLFDQCFHNSFMGNLWSRLSADAVYIFSVLGVTNEKIRKICF